MRSVFCLIDTLVSHKECHVLIVRQKADLRNEQISTIKWPLFSRGDPFLPQSFQVFLITLQDCRLFQVNPASHSFPVCPPISTYDYTVQTVANHNFRIGRADSKRTTLIESPATHLFRQECPVVSSIN